MGMAGRDKQKRVKQLEKQPRSTHNCHSLCAHTHTHTHTHTHIHEHFNMQQTMIFFLREQVELVGYNFLQKGIRKKRVRNWKKNARGN
jgi:DNA-binding transcriptional regulator YiaG